MNVTAVLLNYKRPRELREIEKNIRQYPFITDVIIWDNSTAHNFISFGRYLGAQRALNEHIYTQDDDCIIENLPEIYAAYNGSKLVNGMKRERMAEYTGRDSLVGWGAFFKKEWVNILDRYVQVYGKDYIFMRECDRIFTTLLSSFVDRHTVPAIVRDFPSAMSPDSLSLQPNHAAIKSIALKRAHDLLPVGAPANA